MTSSFASSASTLAFLRDGSLAGVARFLDGVFAAVAAAFFLPALGVGVVTASSASSSSSSPSAAEVPGTEGIEKPVRNLRLI